MHGLRALRPAAKLCEQLGSAPVSHRAEDTARVQLDHLLRAATLRRAAALGRAALGRVAPQCERAMLDEEDHIRLKRRPAPRSGRSRGGAARRRTVSGAVLVSLTADEPPPLSGRQAGEGRDGRRLQVLDQLGRLGLRERCEERHGTHELLEPLLALPRALDEEVLPRVPVEAPQHARRPRHHRGRAHDVVPGEGQG
eukprot:scaffold117740_cov51-Phaeocystis_antarctica.AAC.2